MPVIQSVQFGFSFVLASRLEIPPREPPAAVPGQPYEYQVVVQGGTAPYAFSGVAGLPEGLSCSASGLISGTVPLSAAPGAYAVTGTVADSGS